MQLNHRHIFVTGLPRAGSTLLCQLLQHQNELYCSGRSSPLAHLITGLRNQWSNDSFLLSQLDDNFDAMYARLGSAYRGLINGWFNESDKSVVVDKNRAWLGMIDLALTIDPQAKLIVCVRELGQLFGSIEHQHQKTVLLDSGDRTADLTPYGRATAYFKEGGMVASSLSGLESAVKDIDSETQKHLYIMKYEDMMYDPDKTMRALCDFMQITYDPIDFDKLTVQPSEADSHYRYKFTHTTYSALKSPRTHRIPVRTQSGLQGQHKWFYEQFYPDYLQT